MGRQPSNRQGKPSPKAGQNQTPKAGQNQKKPLNPGNVKSLLEPSKSDMFQHDDFISDSSSNNNPHMMNIPDDDDFEVPQFGNKDAYEPVQRRSDKDLKITKQQARQMYKDASLDLNQS